MLLGPTQPGAHKCVLTNTPSLTRLLAPGPAQPPDGEPSDEQSPRGGQGPNISASNQNPETTQYALSNPRLFV